jgi:hypothetical protein
MHSSLDGESLRTYAVSIGTQLVNQVTRVARLADVVQPVGHRKLQSAILTGERAMSASELCDEPRVLIRSEDFQVKGVRFESRISAHGRGIRGHSSGARCLVRRSDLLLTRLPQFAGGVPEQECEEREQCVEGEQKGVDQRMGVSAGGWVFVVVFGDTDWRETDVAAAAGCCGVVGVWAVALLKVVSNAMPTNVWM